MILKMKLALFILLACLVKMSFEQGFPYYPRYYNDRYRPIPTYLHGTDGGIQHDKPINFYITPEVGIAEQDAYYYGTHARSPQKYTHSNQEARFFAFLQNLFYRNPFITTTSTKVRPTTSTVVSTVYTRAVVLALQSCIPSYAFFNYATRTTLIATSPCLRKRRNFFEIEKDETTSIIHPSKVSQIEISALPDSQPSTYEVYSSRSDLEFPSNKWASVNNLDGSLQSQAVTVTSTITSYFFSTTTVKKTVLLGTSLVCMPPGFTMC